MHSKEGPPKSHGIYTIPEAARIILATHPLPGVTGAFQQDFQWRLLHWVDDRVIQHGRFDDRLSFPERFTTFEALISMRIVFLLWTRGVSIGTLSRAEKLLIDELGVLWPLASKPIWRAESPAFPRFSALVAESKHGPDALDFLEEWLAENADGLEFDESGMAFAWHAARNIVIDGRIISGRPSISRRRIWPAIIRDCLEGGDSLEETMDGYVLTEEQVYDAVAWEKRLAAIDVIDILAIFPVRRVNEQKCCP